jgi:hypothetical protein
VLKVKHSRTGGASGVAIDPTGRRRDALDAFLETKLREGFEIETRTNTHAIVAHRKFLRLFRSPERYVVSVDEHGRVTMVPAEPIRS